MIQRLLAVSLVIAAFSVCGAATWADELVTAECLSPSGVQLACVAQCPVGTTAVDGGAAFCFGGTCNSNGIHNSHVLPLVAGLDGDPATPVSGDATGWLFRTDGFPDPGESVVVWAHCASPSGDDIGDVEPGNGNNECVSFCRAAFPPSAARGHCITDAAHGIGPCFE